MLTEATATHTPAGTLSLRIRYVFWKVCFFFFSSSPTLPRLLIRLNLWLRNEVLGTETDSPTADNDRPHPPTTLFLRSLCCQILILQLHLPYDGLKMSANFFSFFSMDFSLLRGDPTFKARWVENKLDKHSLQRGSGMLQRWVGCLDYLDSALTVEINQTHFQSKPQWMKH